MAASTPPLVSRRAFLRAAALALALPGAPAAAETGDDPVAGEVPRRVLALYKGYERYAAVGGERPKTPALNEIHDWAQMPLNWLGFMVDYHDVARGLPADAVMARYRAVVTWYQTDEIDEPLAYARWLGAQARAGRRLVILGTLGAFRDRRSGTRPSLEALSAALAPAGLVFGGDWTADQRVIEVRFKDPRMVEFERPLPPGLPYYERFVARHPGSRPHLVLGRRDRPDSASHVVVSGPWGGFAAGDYVVHVGSLLLPEPGAAGPGVDGGRPLGIEFGAQWHVNPFAFLEHALGVADWPRPDVTTLNGRRVAFVHIDGDGLRNASGLRRGAPSGEVILDEILRRHALPTTVSVIAAETDPALLGTAGSRRLARAILALPHVEAASHTFFHPLDWERRTRSFDLPGHPYSDEIETAGSVRHIAAHLLPAGKAVRVFQWSGAANATEPALAAVEGLGLGNINGGDSMRDRPWSSYTSVAPLLRPVGRHWQVYAAAANENVYTNLWTGPFHGYRRVVETFRNLGHPRRVAPIDVYYHFYSGERVAALEALRAVYAWVLAQPTARVFTSEYLASVAGFRTARLARAGGGWRVWNQGGLRTLRFDHADGGVDMRRSRGVLGWERSPQGALYVHLAGPGEALVVPGPGSATGAWLSSASHGARRMGAGDGVFPLRLDGVGPKAIAVGGCPPGRRVTLIAETGGLRQAIDVRADGEGIARAEIPAAGPVTVHAA